MKKMKRQSSSGLSTPGIKDNSDHRNQQRGLGGRGSSRTSIRGIDVDDDSGPFQPPSRGGIPTPYHANPYQQPNPISETSNHINNNQGMYYNHHHGGGPNTGPGVGGSGNGCFGV